MKPIMSLLAAAMAADKEFFREVVKEFLDSVELAKFERSLISDLVRDSKSPERPRTNSL